MGRILIAVLLLLSTSVFGQYEPGYTGVNSGYDWLRGKFRALQVPAGQTVGFQTGQSRMSGGLYVDTTGADSGFYYSGPNQVWHKLAKASSVSGNSNIGSGYRWAVPNTNNIKTAFGGINILIDSTTNTNGLTFHADTTTGAGKLATQGDITRATALVGFEQTIINNPLLTANRTVNLNTKRLSFASGSNYLDIADYLEAYYTGSGKEGYLTVGAGSNSSYVTGVLGNNMYWSLNAGTGSYTWELGSSTNTSVTGRWIDHIYEVSNTGFMNSSFISEHLEAWTMTPNGAVSSERRHDSLGIHFLTTRSTGASQIGANYKGLHLDGDHQIKIDSMLTQHGSDTTNYSIVGINKTTGYLKRMTYWPSGGGSGITVGTTTITSGTSGAIPFNGAGVYQEDPTQLFWDNSNNRLGVGTNSPSFKFHVVGQSHFKSTDATTATVRFEDDGTSGRSGNYLINDVGKAATMVLYGSGVVATQMGVSTSNSLQVLGITSDNMAVGTLNSAPLVLGTNDTKRIEIASTGLITFHSATQHELQATLKDISAPSTPSGGYGSLYVNSDNPYYKDDGGTVTKLNEQLSKTKVIESPGSAENLYFFYTDKAITVQKVAYALRGSSPSVTFDIVFHTDRSSGSPNELFGTNVVGTSTTGTTTTSFSDATIPAGSYVWIVTSATSGTINEIGITLTFKED